MTGLSNTFIILVSVLTDEHDKTTFMYWEATINFKTNEL